VSLSFLPEAEAEYLEAVRFYEEKRAGLGLALIEAFERSAMLAQQRPNAWKLVHASGIRRIGLARFPFAIFFRAVPGGVQVAAFAHHRQRPGYWHKRAKRSLQAVQSTTRQSLK
jgi:toxin ParE1/3/4